MSRVSRFLMRFAMWSGGLAGVAWSFLGEPARSASSYGLGCFAALQLVLERQDSPVFFRLGNRYATVSREGERKKRDAIIDELIGGPDA